MMYFQNRPLSLLGALLGMSFTSELDCVFLILYDLYAVHNFKWYKLACMLVNRVNFDLVFYLQQ